MNELAFVLTLTLSIPWGGEPEASASPDIWIGSEPTQNVVLSPLELTWSPTDGFGARSTAQATIPVAR